MPDFTRSGERFLYVGCVHEASAALLERLQYEAGQAPDYLIFTGDLTGSPEMETFKRLFYNHVYNRARRELGLGTKNAQLLTDEDLLSFVGINPPKPGHTLRDGVIDLLAFQYQLEGATTASADLRARQHSNKELADTIRHISSFEYYGPWVGTLPLSVRQGVIRTIEANTQKLLAAIKPFQEAGTAVHVCGGNWDRASVTQETFGQDVEVYDTIPALQQAGVVFHDSVGSLETKRSVHVFLPYWSLAQWTAQEVGALADAQSEVASARGNKTIIVVAHGEPNWRVHNTTSLSEPTGDRKIVIDRLDACLLELVPDEVVYPHQHNLLTRANGTKLAPNTKYVLETFTDFDLGYLVPSNLLLIDDKKFFGREPQGQIIASYVPYQHIGHLIVPSDGNPRPSLFGGDRDPIYVS